MEGFALDFMLRLRELDHEVEQLRAALAALHHHLAATRAPLGGARVVRRAEEYLVAYA